VHSPETLPMAGPPVRTGGPASAGVLAAPPRAVGPPPSPQPAPPGARPGPAARRPLPPEPVPPAPTAPPAYPPGPAPAPDAGGAPDPAAASAGEMLRGALGERAGDFLRAFRQHAESGGDTAAAVEAARALRDAARRISGTLQTFRPLLDPVWADRLAAELGWLADTLAEEQACAIRLNRLLGALARLSGAAAGAPAAPRDRTPATAANGTEPAAGPVAVPAPAPSSAGPGTGTGSDTGPRPTTGTHRTAPLAGGTATAGAARAAALLERRLGLARSRAHTAALQALGSARCHALADEIAVLASEPRLGPTSVTAPPDALLPPADAAERRLLTAVTALPLGRAAQPYNADALDHDLAAAGPADGCQDDPWHRVSRLLRLHHDALEVVAGLRPDAAGPAAARLTRAALLLDRHRDAAEAAEAAAEAARTPRIAAATAYALGVLHADQRHEVEAARFAFQDVWPGSLSLRAGRP
jgi:hypothetical protein